MIVGDLYKTLLPVVLDRRFRFEWLDREIVAMRPGRVGVNSMVAVCASFPLIVTVSVLRAFPSSLTATITFVESW